MRKCFEILSSFIALTGQCTMRLTDSVSLDYRMKKNEQTHSSSDVTLRFVLFHHFTLFPFEVIITASSRTFCK